MTTLKDFVKDKDFGAANSFPEGETVIDTEQATIEEHKVEMPDGKVKKRYLITEENKSYWAGIKVMKGIKEQVSAGVRRVKVIRQGKDLETSYVVQPHDSEDDKGDLQ